MHLMMKPEKYYHSPPHFLETLNQIVNQGKKKTLKTKCIGNTFLQFTIWLGSLVYERTQSLP